MIERLSLLRGTSFCDILGTPSPDIKVKKQILDSTGKPMRKGGSKVVIAIEETDATAPPTTPLKEPLSPSSNSPTHPTGTRRINISNPNRTINFKVENRKSDPGQGGSGLKKAISSKTVDSSIHKSDSPPGDGSPAIPMKRVQSIKGTVNSSMKNTPSQSYLIASSSNQSLNR